MSLALVTGGFRRLGAAIAGRLAGDGWALALHCRERAEPETVLAALLAHHQTRWHGFAADLENEEAVIGLLPAIEAAFGHAPSLIVNCASRFVYDDAMSMSWRELTAHHAVNVVAPVMLAQALHRAGGGCVINITDQRVRQPNGDQFSYTLSKQALGVATETLARALAPDTRVNAVAPGLTIPTGDYRPAQMVALEKMMPLKRLPEADEIANAVAYLAGAESVTGQTVYVDGGAALKSFERDFLFLGGTDQDPR